MPVGKLPVTFAEFMGQQAAQYLRDCLSANDGNATLAARAAGMHRSRFYRRCAKYGINTRLERRSHKITSFASWRAP